MDRRNISPQQLSQDRQDVLLKSAREAFLVKGFGACSVDYIAKLSGVSKSTIYRHFDNKEQIFESVNLEIARQQGEEITAFKLDFNNPYSSLVEFAQHVYAVDTKPEYLEFFRLLIAEAGRMPELTARIREQGIMKVLGMTTDFFQQLIDLKQIQHPDAQQAAITFYVLARGNFRPLLGSSNNSQAELARTGVDITIFLKGIGLTEQNS